MKKIGKILWEIESSLRRIDIFTVVIKTLVLLLVSYLILFVIGIQPFYAFIPAIVYFMSSVFLEGRIDYVRRMESRYKELDEKIRTARDYRDKDSLVLDELEQDIILNLRQAKLSDFFSYSRATILIFLLVLSVSASLYIASREIRLIEFDDLIDNAMKRFRLGDNETMEEADFTGAQESIMEVGNEKIEVEINPVGLDFDFSDVRETGDYEFSTSFPKEVFISSGAAYESEFTEEQQALIKRYFEKKNS